MNAEITIDELQAHRARKAVAERLEELKRACPSITVVDNLEVLAVVEVTTGSGECVRVLVDPLDLTEPYRPPRAPSFDAVDAADSQPCY